MSLDFTVVIPARLRSTRLPGKPLLAIAGKPMVQHVWEQARKSAASRVVIATDDASILEACQAFGAEVLMTRADHESGTDRLAEVAAHLGLPADAIVVNVQGDEPLIPPVIIDQVAANLAAHPEAGIATLAEPIHEPETVFNPNAVKARRRAVSPPHRHVRLPRRLPAGLCRLGPVRARTDRSAGAAACLVARRAYSRRGCHRGACRGR